MIKKVAAVLLAVILTAINAVPVFAYLANPTSISIQSAKVFRNLAQTGDMLIVFHYNIAFTSYPNTSATSSVIFRLYDTDGTTILSQANPYNFSLFETNGYGDGVSSFYFTANQSPAWAGAYSINILATPAYFSPAQNISYPLALTDYDTSATQADSQNALYTEVIRLCDVLKGIYPTYSLKAVTDSGIVLSVYGEPYFRAVIPGIQTLSPLCFFVQQGTPQPIAVQNYTISQRTQNEILNGSDLMIGATRIGTHLGGISGAAVFGIMAFIMAIVICVVTYRLGWGVEPAALITAGIGIWGSITVGNFFYTLTMIGGLVAGMGISYVIFLRRA